MKPPAAAPLEQQPDPWFVHADGLEVKQLDFKKAGWTAAQHVHAFDHLTMLAAGSLRVWVNDDYRGDFRAPQAFLVKAGEAHLFVALEDNTIAYCIHNLHGKEEPEVLARGELPKG